MRTSKILSVFSGEENVFQKVSKKGLRTFLSFDSLDEFILWYKTSDYRSVFEVIWDGPQKIKFDIDGKKDKKEVLRDVENICSFIKSKFGGRPLVYDISDETKVSFHIILDEVYVLNVSDAKRIADHISKRFPDVIDDKVYNGIQFFRCEGSTKFGENRIKRSYGHKHLFQRGIEKGLIGYVDDCSPIFVENHPDIFERKDSVGSSIHRSSEIIESFSMIEGTDYEVRFERDSMICLNLKRPYHCPNCSRVHDKENPFLIRSKNETFFFCRRSDESSIVRYGKSGETKGIWFEQKK